MAAFVAIAVGMTLVALGIYLLVGSPQFAARPVPTAADGPTAPRGAATLAELEAYVARSPKDARAWVMLARLRMQSDQFAPAADVHAEVEGFRRIRALRHVLGADLVCHYFDDQTDAEPDLAALPARLDDAQACSPRMCH